MQLNREVEMLHSCQQTVFICSCATDVFGKPRCWERGEPLSTAPHEVRHSDCWNKGSMIKTPRYYQMHIFGTWRIEVQSRRFAGVGLPHVICGFSHELNDVKCESCSDHLFDRIRRLGKISSPIRSTNQSISRSRAHV